MRANTPQFRQIKKELKNSQCVKRCAKRFGTTGDLTAMRICYLLRHYPTFSISQVAELVGVSISASSRALKKLKEVDVVTSQRQSQTVFYSLQDNEFTRALIRELGISL